MTHTYKVSGMTCDGCKAKVQSLLSKVEGVKDVSIDLVKGEASIEMDKHVLTGSFKSALVNYPKYQISETVHHQHAVTPDITEDETKSWFVTYKPILLIFGYIISVSLLVEYMLGEFIWMRWMSHFMAGFFLVFSFFKLLNLKGFSDSYSMYDIVAKKWNGWGYVYAFIELSLGIGFLINFNPILINGITLIVMTVSIIGVLQSVFAKRKIKCACLGDVFNLPMSSITIIEDSLMIVMSAVMLAAML